MLYIGPNFDRSGEWWGKSWGRLDFDFEAACHFFVAETETIAIAIGKKCSNEAASTPNR